MSYKINGVTMPQGITEYNTETNDLYSENTGRDEAGYNHLDLIRAGVRKWKIKHTMLTKTEKEQIVSSLDPLGFSFVSPDGEIANCYATISSMQRVIGSVERWNVELSIIEN